MANIVAGDIGPFRKEVTFEPVPESAPVEPVQVPETDPEKVPA